MWYYSCEKGDVLPKKENLVGKKYERLTVIEDLGVFNKNRKVLCKCECGNKKIVFAQSLKRKNTKSCGCLSKELSRER